MAVGFLIGCFLLLGLWQLAIVSLYHALSLGLIWFSVSFFLPLFPEIGYKLGGGVKLTPEALIVERNFIRHVYAWDDVDSVAVEVWKVSTLDRLITRVFYGARSDTPYARIAFRRTPDMSAQEQDPGQGAEPAALDRTIVLFVRQPEAFVRDAQQFLQDGRRSGL
jgi:hypothetical protein